MKKTFIKTLSVAALSGAVMLTSCGDGGKKADTETMTSDTTKVDTTTVKLAESSTEMTYQIPSPKEMFVFIKQVAGKNNKRVDMLSNPDNAKNYTDFKSGFLKKNSTTLNRSLIGFTSFNGNAIQRFNILAPIGLIVLSITSRSVRPPSLIVPYNSRLRTVKRSSQT